MKNQTGRRRILIGAVATLVAAFNNAHAAEPATAAPARELIVFAAASLRESFETLGHLFEARHPGVRVRFNLAGSQELRFQIQQGAKADVFASADLVHATAAAEAGLTDKPRIFARNLPVVVVPHANPAGLKSFADLPRAAHLVIGAPGVPIGRYTLAIFKKAAATYGDGFGKTLDSRIASRELNVRQVLAKVSLGEADAGVVYRSDAVTAKTAVDIIDIPTTINVVAEYAVAPVKAALQPALARQWCDLLLSTEGSAVLAKAGFLANDLASATPATQTRNERQP